MRQDHPCTVRIAHFCPLPLCGFCMWQAWFPRPRAPQTSPLFKISPALCALHTLVHCLCVARFGSVWLGLCPLLALCILSIACSVHSIHCLFFGYCTWLSFCPLPLCGFCMWQARFLRPCAPQTSPIFKISLPLVPPLNTPTQNDASGLMMIFF